MDLALKEKLLDLPELRRRLRQLRWFKRAFKGNADLVAAHLGIRAEIDDRLLNEAFFAWLAAIAPVQHDESFDRADRILFMGRLGAARAVARPSGDHLGRGAHRPGGRRCDGADRAFLAGRLPLHEFLRLRDRRGPPAGVRHDARARPGRIGPAHLVVLPRECRRRREYLDRIPRPLPRQGTQLDPAEQRAGTARAFQTGHHLGAAQRLQLRRGGPENI